MMQLVELVGGIPRRRRQPDYGSLAFVLGYTTAQLQNAYREFMRETIRQSQELGSAMGSLMAMLLAAQAATTGTSQGNLAAQSVVGGAVAPTLGAALGTVGTGLAQTGSLTGQQGG